MKLSIFCAALALGFACTAEASLRSDLLSLHSIDANTDGEAPWFCHGLDCPEFTVVNETDAYQIREYQAGDWITTTVDGSGFTVAMTKGFTRLFQYISGANEDSKKMKMTSPVADMLQTEEGFRTTKNNYTISFWVPSDFQGKAPKPTSNDVHIVNIPKRTAYVAQFGGYATEQSLLKEAATLAEAAKADGVELETNAFFWAGYDPPYRVTGRHNEVWLAAKDDSTAF
jgi:hypothetical protein